MIEIRQVGIGPDYVPYRDAWSLQQEVHDEVVAGRQRDTLLLLEHPAVFTAGRRTQDSDLPRDGSEVVWIDRGGRITWHGPGQLVGYPIVTLPEPVDVVAHVRRLEAALIAVCEEFSVQTQQVEGRSGVWVRADQHGPDRKIAAIGIRVAHQVTMHGFALNCDCSFDGFNAIVPCGIVDAGVTSLSAERAYYGLGPVTVAEAMESVRRNVVKELETVFSEQRKGENSVANTA